MKKNVFEKIILSKFYERNILFSRCRKFYLETKSVTYTAVVVAGWTQ